jgi:hypothetical protein
VTQDKDRGSLGDERGLRSLDGGRAALGRVTTNSLPSGASDDPTYDSYVGGMPRLRLVQPERSLLGQAAEALVPPGRSLSRRPENRSARRGGLGVIGPDRVLRSPVSGAGGSDVGALTHALVSTHAPLLDGGLPSDVLARMNEFARALVDANPNRRRVVATEAVGLAYRYLTELAPAPPWRLLGVEFETGRGPVDVAWVHKGDDRVLFDELKTTRIATRKVPTSWSKQVSRYTAAGVEKYGVAFAGVRLLPINAIHLARLSRSSDFWVPVAPTPDDPFRRRSGS